MGFIPSFFFPALKSNEHRMRDANMVYVRHNKLFCNVNLVPYQENKVG